MMSTSSYWCYRCNQSVSVTNQNSISCPNCTGGFVEEISSGRDNYGLNFDQSSSPRLRRDRRTLGDRSPFNPVVVLRGQNEGRGADVAGGDGFELYYNDGASPGLRPLPSSMSELLLGSGFERLLDQLSQIELDSIARFNHPPASKAAIESMPTVEIQESHICDEINCGVCKEAFELGVHVKKMPCQHLYHSDCILPWLALRNSCPICRHVIPSEGEEQREENEDEPVGLTIWRLPHGGFAVGRFSGVRGGERGERGFPVVFTEMDGGFRNNNGVTRGIPWGVGERNSTRRGGRLRGIFGNLLACFGGRRSRSRAISRLSRH